MRNSILTVSLLTLMIFIAIGFQACRKDGCTDPSATNFNRKANKDDGSCVYGDNGDYIEPEIIIYKPANNDTFQKGDTLYFDLLISDNALIQEYKVKIYRLAPRNSVFEYHNYVSQKVINVNSFWVIPTHFDDNEDFKFEVSATDNNRNYTRKIHHFHVK
jgi:hypothetical protein